MKDILHIDDDLWVWIYGLGLRKQHYSLLFVYLILCLKTYNFAASIQEKNVKIWTFDLILGGSSWCC